MASFARIVGGRLTEQRGSTIWRITNGSSGRKTPIYEAKGLEDYADEETKETQEWKEHKERHDARVKLLTDSAAALKQSSPDLAKGLQEMTGGKHKKCRK